MKYLQTNYSLIRCLPSIKKMSARYYACLEVAMEFKKATEQKEVVNFDLKKKYFMKIKVAIIIMIKTFVIAIANFIRDFSRFII